MDNVANVQVAALIDQFAMLVKLIGISGLIGTGMPFLVAFIIQSKWGVVEKNIVVFFSCIGVGVITLLAMGQDMHNLAVVLPAMIIGTRLAYEHYWKPSGLAGWIEDLTNVKSAKDTVA